MYVVYFSLDVINIPHAQPPVNPVRQFFPPGGGKDHTGTPRLACVRGCRGTFRGECRGSDKRYAFSNPAAQDAATLEVYEAPIDALSGATLRLLSGNDWRIVHYIALGGLSHLQLSHDP